MNFLTAARRESLKVVHISPVVAMPSMRLMSALSSVAAVLRLSQSALLYKGIWRWVCSFLQALVLISQYGMLWSEMPGTAGAVR